MPFQYLLSNIVVSAPSSSMLSRTVTRNIQITNSVTFQRRFIFLSKKRQTETWKSSGSTDRPKTATGLSSFSAHLRPFPFLLFFTSALSCWFSRTQIWSATNVFPIFSELFKFTYFRNFTPAIICHSRSSSYVHHNSVDSSDWYHDGATKPHLATPIPAAANDARGRSVHTPETTITAVACPMTMFSHNFVTVFSFSSFLCFILLFSYNS